MNQINLVPIGYKKRHRRKWYILCGAIGSVVTCMVLVTLALIPVLQISAAEKEQVWLIEQLAAKEIIQTKDIIAQTNEAHNRNVKASKLLADLDRPTHISRQTMDVVVGSVPKGLRMSEVIMAQKDHTVFIEGHAKNADKVSQYIVQLYNTGQFEILEYEINPNPNAKLANWIDYNITIKPKSLEEDEEAEISDEEAIEDEIEMEPKKDSGGADLL